ncbi:MAG: hypothetical protein B7Z72_00420 [Gemmatimonadetes bacterium 21-71-4]|nr:MAG: hypothetical protein B7Z72_00420 [Gemmatimonadetes bacterium 21-71-4]
MLQRSRHVGGCAHHHHASRPHRRLHTLPLPSIGNARPGARTSLDSCLFLSHPVPRFGVEWRAKCTDFGIPPGALLLPRAGRRITTSMKKRSLKLGVAALAFTILAPQAVLGQGPEAASLPLRPGDRVLVKIWADTSLIDTLHVDDKGFVMLPRLGPLSVTGVTAPAIGDSVRKAYAAILRTVSVEVTPLRRVSVIGEVHHPDILYLETNATVRDAVAKAGGVDDIGQEDPIYLMRDSTTVALNRWRQRADDAAIVHSGDVILVRRESWVKRNIFSIISGVGIVTSLMITIFHK